VFSSSFFSAFGHYKFFTEDDDDDDDDDGDVYE